MSETSTLMPQRNVAWHGLGANATGTSVQSVLDVAGLSWNVRRSPAHYLLSDGRILSSGKYYCNYREDTCELLGVTGRGYSIVQNDEAFAFADYLISEGASYEKVGSLRCGGLVWLLLKLPERSILNDAYAPYVLLVNGHDGRTSFNVCCTPVRVVCSNTVNFALREAKRRFSFNHTINVMPRIKRAEVVLRNAETYLTGVFSVAEKLALRKITDSDVNRMSLEFFPIADGVIGQRNLERREQLLSCYNQYDLDNVRGTAYGFLLAVSDYASHYQLPATGVSESRRERFFERTVMHESPMFQRALHIMGV